MAGKEVAVVETKKRSNELQLASVPNIVPLRKKPKKEVLDEDTYLQALDTIIQRDFYPDLPKLQNQLEWLEAEERKDMVKLREIHMRLRKTGRAQSVRETPGQFETPLTFTPSIPSSTPLGSAPASNLPAPLVSNTIPGNVPEMGLDQYQTYHTSEDNSSFDYIIDKQNSVRKLQYSWMYDKDAPLQITGPEVSAGAIQTWKYVAKNQLMYHPIGSELTEKEEKQVAMGPPKEIAKTNTRLHGPVAGKNAHRADKTLVSDLPQDERSLLQQKRALKDGKVDLDELRGFKKSVYESPRVGGFGFLLTPSPAPGLDASPFTTWGSVEGAPLMLDPLDTPISFGSGPAFKMPDTPKREQIAMEVTEKALARTKKGKHAAPSSSVRKPAHSPMASPLRTDMQLRASYSTPQKAAGNVTPSPSRKVAVSPVTSKPSFGTSPSITKRAPATSHHTSKTNSLTDDLLKL